MAQQLGSGQVSAIAEVKFEVNGIKKMVDQLYDRPFIPALVVVEVKPNIYVKNIWEIPELVEEPQERNKSKHQNVEKDSLKKAKKGGILSERDQQTRVQQIQNGAGSSKQMTYDVDGVVKYPQQLMYQ